MSLDVLKARLSSLVDEGTRRLEAAIEEGYAAVVGQGPVVEVEGVKYVKIPTKRMAALRAHSRALRSQHREVGAVAAGIAAEARALAALTSPSEERAALESLADRADRLAAFVTETAQVSLLEDDGASEIAN